MAVSRRVRRMKKGMKKGTCKRIKKGVKLCRLKSGRVRFMKA